MSNFWWSFLRRKEITNKQNLPHPNCCVYILYKWRRKSLVLKLRTWLSSFNHCVWVCVCVERKTKIDWNQSLKLFNHWLKFWYIRTSGGFWPREPALPRKLIKWISPRSIRNRTLCIRSLYRCSTRSAAASVG